MNFKKIWKEEPIGFVALVFSIISVLTPLSFGFFSETFFYADNYDIRCSKFSGEKSTVYNGIIYQETSCIITNNSASDISIVGIKPTLFENKTPYSEFTFPTELKTEPQPLFLRRGESRKVETTYYLLTTNFLSSAPFEKCAVASDFSGLGAKNLRPCQHGKSLKVNLFQYFYEGISFGFFDLNRSGLTIEVGDGREFYYQPEIELIGFRYPADSTENTILHDAFEDVAFPKKWASVPGSIFRVFVFIVGYFILMATWMLTKWLFIALRNSFRKYSVHQESDDIEKPPGNYVASDKNKEAEKAKTVP